MSASGNVVMSCWRKSTSRPSRWRSERSCKARAGGGAGEGESAGEGASESAGEGEGGRARGARAAHAREANDPSKTTRKKQTHANQRRVGRGSIGGMFSATARRILDDDGSARHEARARHARHTRHTIDTKRGAKKRGAAIRTRYRAIRESVVRRRIAMPVFIAVLLGVVEGLTEYL